MTSHPPSPRNILRPLTSARPQPARHLRQPVAWAVVLSLTVAGGIWLGWFASASASNTAGPSSPAAETKASALVLEAKSPTPVASTKSEGKEPTAAETGAVKAGASLPQISSTQSWFSVSQTASITADVDTYDYESVQVHLADDSGLAITGLAGVLDGAVEFAPPIGPNLSSFIEDVQEPGLYTAKLTSTKAGSFKVSVTVNQAGVVTIPVKSGDNDTATFLPGPAVATSVLTVTPASLKAGGTATARVAVVDQFGNPVPGQGVIFWTSPSSLIDTPTHRVTVRSNAVTGLAELPLTTSVFGGYVIHAALSLPRGDIEVTNSGKAEVLFLAERLEQPTAVPSSGASVSGKGAPGDEIVIKNAAGRVIGTAVVKADGSWKITLTPPAKEGDVLSITQVDSTGRESEPLKLRIGLIKIGLEASKVHSLELQVATVCNLQPGEKVTLTLHSKSVSLGWRVADDRGHAVFRFLVPPEVGLGHHHVTAVGEVSGLAESDVFDVLAPAAEPTETASLGARSNAESSNRTPTPRATYTVSGSPAQGSNHYQGLPDTGSDHLLPVLGLAGCGLLGGVTLMVVSARRRQRIDLKSHL